MSEINTDDSLRENGLPNITMTVSAGNTVQAPIDTTLTIAGMGADAKATGDAIQAVSNDAITSANIDIILNRVLN